MRVLFVYPNISRGRHIQIGIASLSATLKSKGHICSLFDTTFLRRSNIEQLFCKRVSTFKPDLIAVSCRSHEWQLVKELLNEISSTGIPTVIGGPHPTILPDEPLGNKDIDFVIRGEGELALVELVSRLEDGGDVCGIANLCAKINGYIIKNSPRNFIENLDELPFPDWDIFDEKHLLRESPFILQSKRNVIRTGHIETMRGCPYACTYCINDFITNFYKGKGKKIRTKSVERAISESEYFKQRYNLERIFFADETFLLNTDRLKEFTPLYKKRIGIPFFFTTRPETVTEEKIQMVKYAGADVLSIGIESGNEQIRVEVLNRKMSQDSIIEAFRLARKAGLETQAYVMLGLPTETKKMLQDTLELLHTIKPDYVVPFALFPYEGTEIFNKYLDKESLPENYKSDLYNANFSKPIFSLPDLSKKEIERLVCLTVYFYKRPKFLFPLMFLIARNDLLWNIWLVILKIKNKLNL